MSFSAAAIPIACPVKPPRLSLDLSRSAQNHSTSASSLLFTCASGVLRWNSSQKERGWAKPRPDSLRPLAHRPAPEAELSH